MLEANVRRLGDMPPMPSVNVWELARVDAQIQQCIERGESVPEDLARARGLLSASSVGLAASSGSPLMASPLLQSLAAASVNVLRPAVDAGDGGAVLEAVALCLAHGLVAPGWLAAAFVMRYERTAVGDAKSWADTEAFGAAVPPGLNVSGVRARQQFGPRAYRVALQLLAEDPSRPIDKGFYESVGSEIGRSATATETLVREHVASSPEAWPALADLKRRLVDANGDLGLAWSAWADANSLAAWCNSGGTEEEWAAAFGRTPRTTTTPKNCDDFPGLLA